MKIGLLTYYWENNVGQYWQALATLRALQAEFPKARVELIHLRHWGKLNDKYLTKNDFKHPWRIYRRYLFHRSYRLGRKANFTYSAPEFVSKDYKEASAYIERQNYDLVVVGADVVLKPLSDEKVQGKVPIYWLPKNLSVPKMLLASSADIERADLLSDDVLGKITESLSGFDWIGVRDSMTKKLCDDLESAKVPVQRIPDPTFSIPLDKSWSVEASKILPKAPCGQKLAIVHFSKHHGGGDICGTLKKAGYYVVSLSNALPNSDKTLQLTPTEWAGMSTVADLVVTMSFHESIFALKHGRRVIAVDTQPNRYDSESFISKTRCLLSDFGLEDICHLNLQRDNPIETRLRNQINQVESISFDKYAEAAADMGLGYMRLLKEAGQLLLD